ncbi:MAG: DUF3883 domain-containing protein [Rhodospirillaceae bacterium]|nr:DUF3883 domain-containing protein [Rhodospirillales bacterium]
MNHYRGPEDDIYAGGFDYPQEHGFGHELFNFMPVNGTCYGYVQTRTGIINIDSLGADGDDTFIDDVTVIWTAPKKEGGRYVVGWYKGARVHRQFEQGRVRGRTVEGERVGYLIEAPADQCTLIAADDRDFAVPHHGPGLPGTASVFYPEGKAQIAGWLANALAFIEAWDGPAIGLEQGGGLVGGKGWPPNTDPAHRALVEQHAIDETKRQLGDITADRQEACCGWDLEFLRDGRTLCVEVKGLSGAEVAVELTPNEYTAMAQAVNGGFLEGDYRLAVVTRALEDNRVFHLFAHEVADTWLCERTGRRIKVKERTGARLG